MDTALLATKLRIPPQPPHGMRRARLTDALEQAIPRYKLALVTAPAGYGKTTLLAQWAQASHFPIAWLSLDEDDNDLERFLRYLLAGWLEIQPGIGESPLGMLLGSAEPASEAVLPAFLNAAAALRDHLVFVLDDYHLIEDPAIHRALAFLLDHLPPMLHVVLAGRAQPDLPLARYRARQEMLELHAEDLRFLADETVDFLNERMGLDLAQRTVAEIHTRLEGWIAGLQLVALALRRRESLDTLAVSGRHRYIADYLTDDVLTHLPGDIRWFLLQTCILEQLSAPLCDAVTGTRNSQDMLDLLERENLFLVALDDQREWFRYHPLFAEVLQAELARSHPGEAATLQHRAAAWYLEHDLPEPAFRHALAAEDVELVVHILEHYVPAKLTGGDIRVVERWLDSLPPEWQSASPIIAFARASVLLFTGQVDEGLRHVDEVERRLLLAGTRRQQAMVKALRCIIACYQNDLTQAETYADLALQDLPEDELELRNGTYGALGDTYRGQRRWAEARACYLKTLDFTQAHTFHSQSVISFGALADLDLRQGHLRGAAAYWKKALAVIGKHESWGVLPLPLIGWVFIRMGEIHYEWNNLGEVGEYLPRGLERAELSGDVQGMIAGYLLACRLKLVAGEITAAGDYLERARPLIENAAFPDWAGRFGRLRLEFLLAQRKIGPAIAWAQEMMQSDALEGGRESEVARIALARVLILKGDHSSLAQAQTLLEHITPLASAEGRMGVHIEALLLQSLACWRHGDSPGALMALEYALRLAEPEGYVRLFADLGPPMAWMLQEARARGVLPGYTGELLAAFGQDTAFASISKAPLPEPLSAREQDVLRLIAAGLTNREIAQTLIISPETVKKHTGNIYSKLGVGNRIEAAARARELDLLG